MTPAMFLKSNHLNGQKEKQTYRSGPSFFVYSYEANHKTHTHTHTQQSDDVTRTEQKRKEQIKRKERTSEQKGERGLMQCSPVNNRADTGGQGGMKRTSATRKAR